MKRFRRRPSRVYGSVARVTEREDKLDDAIRDMLDFAAGYRGRRSEAERLKLIEEIGMQAIRDWGVQKRL